MRIISKVTLTSFVFTGRLFGALNYQEAEDLASQMLGWYVIHEGNAGANAQDRDRNHASSASSKA